MVMENQNILNWAEQTNMSKGVYEVLKVLPEDTLGRIIELWHSRKDGYFADLWDDISWEVALELLWHPQRGCINEPLAYKVIENVLVESIEAQGGINAAFIPHPIQKELGTFFTAADYQVVFALSYCLEELMTQRTFNKIANSMWIAKLLEEKGISAINGKKISPFHVSKVFKNLLAEIDSTTNVEEFIQKVVKIGREKADVKRYDVSLQFPADVNPYEVLMALGAKGKIKGFTIK